MLDTKFTSLTINNLIIEDYDTTINPFGVIRSVHVPQYNDQITCNHCIFSKVNNYLDILLIQTFSSDVSIFYITFIDIY